MPSIRDALHRSDLLTKSKQVRRQIREFGLYVLCALASSPPSYEALTSSYYSIIHSES